MPPKRRDRDSEGSKNSRNEIVQADRDIFLQAFEKPTQIYRYLRTRNLVSPIFLHRTLTYMSQRMSRSHNNRSKFKVDSLLGEKLKSLKTSNCYGDYMTLMFEGFFDKTQSNSDTLVNHQQQSSTEIVRVETMLLKISHKKRKESSSSIIKQIGTTEVQINPGNVHSASYKFPSVSISTELLNSEDGPVTHILLFRLQTVTASGDGASNRMKPDPQIYGSELAIFDKYGRCLLTEGEYQLTLQEKSTKTVHCSPRKYSSWENLTIFSADSPGMEDPFEKSPTLHFHLYWTDKSQSGFMERPLPMQNKLNDVANKENRPNGISHNNNNQSGGTLVKCEKKSFGYSHDIFGIPLNKLQVVFHFVYNNISRQTTDTSNTMDCPWCSLNCMTLYSLLKHLKLCHARFTFSFVQVQNTARIDVSINELFDGSYTGSPHDLIGPAGFAFSRSGPVRRTIVTHILVCRPRRQKPSLTEFIELDENELNSQRPYITGHNRLYHHTMTCLPVHPKELDIDSEGECDPPWLQQKTMMMIDEFTDVNEGEKELMKMWNLHVMKFGFVGDCQIPLACDMFVELRGKELLQKNLYRNFVLHMCSLFDYGLVSPDAFYKTVQKLQKILSDFTEGKDVITEARREHLKHWNNVGVFKQQHQQQKDPHHNKESHCKQQQLKKDDHSDSHHSHHLVHLHQQQSKKITIVTTSTTSITTISTPQTRTKDSLQKSKAECRGVAIKSASNCLPPKNNGVINPKRKLSLTQQQQSSNNSRANQNLEINNAKRKLIQDRDSPPRRRSAGSLQLPVMGEKRARIDTSRRRSVAFVGSVTAGNNISSKTRLSVSLTKVDKDSLRK